MKLSAAPLFLILLMLLKPAEAETRTRLFTDGDWTLDRVNGFKVKDGRDTSEFDDMCVAQTGSELVRLSFAMNARESPVSEEFKRNIYFQLSSAAWKFEFLEASLSLISTEVFYAGNAWYFSDTIAFTVYSDDDFGLGEFAETAGDRVTVIAGDGKESEFEDSMIAVDGDGRVIASLSTKGLKAIYPKLIECAGQNK